jgi:DNA polymerase II
MREYTGWLFDLYAHPEKGLVVWLAGEDGRPYRFHQDFEVTFYVSGPVARLRELWAFLRSKWDVKLGRTTREDLFDGPRDVMEVRVSDPFKYQGLFKQTRQRFPDLTYYDVDIPLSLRFMAAHDVFLMGHCKVTAQPDWSLTGITALDTPEELDPKLPHLRKLVLRPDRDPSSKTPPKYLLVKYGGFSIRAPLDKPRELLALLNGILTTYDPDIIQTRFGDTWLFPLLEELSKQARTPFVPNRDRSVPVLHRGEVSFFNYGRAHYRGPQVHLRGRWHIDVENCMTYGAYGLLGAIEQTRITGVPLQEMARRSPGAGVAAMQTLTALRRKVLIPYQHQKGEIRKTYAQLVRSDRGGLILQPPIGIFANVAVLDFTSMMASIMIEFNVSPETAGAEDEAALEIPELGIKIGSRPGLMPQTLKPMRDKRLALKQLLKSLDKKDPRYRAWVHRYKPVMDGLKWLTVVAYGRLGFANSTFGRINAHEVVSYLSRKVILEAKAVAEDRGFTVLHLYVDSLFVSRPEASTTDFQALADEIERETHLPIELQKVYPWFAFLGTRDRPNTSVANRFYALSADGEHKIRGIALRRRDTPRFVANTQMQILNILAKETDPARLAGLLPEALAWVRERLSLLNNRLVSPDELVVSQTLSRELNEYSHFSPVASAARQLQARGKTPRMGQRIRFIYTGPGTAHAWDLPVPPDPRAIDLTRYREMILRAVYEVLHPLGVTEKILRDWLFGGAGYIMPAGELSSSDPTRLALPLFNTVKYLHVDSP